MKMDGEVRIPGFPRPHPEFGRQTLESEWGRGAVGVVPAAVRSPRDHSPVRGARRGAGRRAVSGRGRSGRGRSPTTYNPLRLGGPACPGPAYPACDVSAHGPLNGRRCGHAEAADWPVERERRVVGAGGRRQTQRAGDGCHGRSDA